MLGSTESAVAGMAFKLKLRKSAEFLFEHSSKGFFPKGHQPTNKGRKQTEYMSDAQIEKTKATRFKKGCIPKNHKEVGYERITRDGYIEVKTAEPNVFELKHRLVWLSIRRNPSWLQYSVSKMEISKIFVSRTYT